MCVYMYVRYALRCKQKKEPVAFIVQGQHTRAILTSASATLRRREFAYLLFSGFISSPFFFIFRFLATT